jgi:acid phosphatase (class A)
MQFFPRGLWPVVVALGSASLLAAQGLHQPLAAKREFAPQLMVPPPPAPGSPALALEMARLRSVITEASPQRLAQAQFDGEHEDPSIFSAAIGRDITKLPATLALLQFIQQQTEQVVDNAKQQFKAPRPYYFDPSLQHCGKSVHTLGSYPSGHAGFAYAVGGVLARLDPAHAPAVLARAEDYALSREICGVHFHIDTEASRVIGIRIADQLLADPSLEHLVSAARAELAGH